MTWTKWRAKDLSPGQVYLGLYPKSKPPAIELRPISYVQEMGGSSNSARGIFCANLKSASEAGMFEKIIQKQGREYTFISDFLDVR